MNILTDFHHSSLMRSLVLLFEHRLGHKIYRPIGEEWHSEGFWKVYDHPATVAQFLTLAQGYQPVDGTAPLNDFVPGKKEDGAIDDCYYCADPEHQSYNKAITLETFKNTKFDIVIASLPQHIEPFKRLIELYQPDAKLILQVGNNWNWEDYPVGNVLASTVTKRQDGGKNVFYYHQEFDLDIFHVSPVPSDKKIYSFINILQNTSGWDDFIALEKQLPEFEFKSYGGQCRDGYKAGAQGVAEGMREARFIFHVKPGGDGYGHVIHNALASGRPLITRKSHYAGCLADKLLVDGVTCIDLDQHSHQEVAAMIRSMDGTPAAAKMGMSARAKFGEFVDFAKEGEAIGEWLKNLK